MARRKTTDVDLVWSEDADSARLREAEEVSDFYLKFAIKYVFFPIFIGGVALGGYIVIFKITLGW